MSAFFTFVKTIVNLIENTLDLRHNSQENEV